MRSCVSFSSSGRVFFLGLGAWVVLGVLGPASAGATITGGGGPRATDCLAVFDAAVNHPATRPRHVRCVDGDPSCDLDGTTDGFCSFAVAVCANSTFDPSQCGLVGLDTLVVEHAVDNGDPKFDPDFQALQTRIDDEVEFDLPDSCTSPVTVRVRIRGPLGKRSRCGPARKKLRLFSRSKVLGGRIFQDRDVLRLICLPDRESGCAPLDLFDSTWDRIQTQILDQHCASSGCHDSNTEAGGLLLENAYRNLVGVAPANPAAGNPPYGWLRVRPFDPETSFLYRKLVCGDKACEGRNGLPDVSFGARMPFGKRRIPASLREVLRLWILDGAPETGWVEGTF
ncbi:MAG: hypothetical protein KatS3mg076_1239 [Candidatus Binatia bacterium]|nr:MAG: hypothetical protein KatS3mg076_1239 [Candidatus Binatia bacterium]